MLFCEVVKNSFKDQSVEALMILRGLEMASSYNAFLIYLAAPDNSMLKSFILCPNYFFLTQLDKRLPEGYIIPAEPLLFNLIV